MEPFFAFTATNFLLYQPLKLSRHRVHNMKNKCNKNRLILYCHRKQRQQSVCNIMTHTTRHGRWRKGTRPPRKHDNGGPQQHSVFCFTLRLFGAKAVHVQQGSATNFLYSSAENTFTITTEAQLLPVRYIKTFSMKPRRWMDGYYLFLFRYYKTLSRPDGPARRGSLFLSSYALKATIF